LNLICILYCADELTWALDAPPQRFRMVTANPSNADDDAVNVVLDLLPPPPPSSAPVSRNESACSDQDDDRSQSDAHSDSGTMSFAVSLVGAPTHTSSCSPPDASSSTPTPALRSPRLCHPAPWNGMMASVPDMWEALQAQLADANSVLRDPQSLMHRSTRAELVYTA
jgi:hypothetical protein